MDFSLRAAGPVYCRSLPVVQNLFLADLLTGYGIGGSLIPEAEIER
jgi:hypothetical protein